MTTYPLGYFEDLLELERTHAVSIHEGEKQSVVEQAIARLHADPEHYGFCVICGLQIDPDRLRIVPATLYCEDDAPLHHVSR